jgi:hypothetical protein
MIPAEAPRSGRGPPGGAPRQAAGCTTALGKKARFQMPQMEVLKIPVKWSSLLTTNTGTMLASLAAHCAHH